MALCDDVRGYWNSRAEGYSLRNCDELDGPEGEALAALFREVLDPKPGMTALEAGMPGDGRGSLARDDRSRAGERRSERP